MDWLAYKSSLLEYLKKYRYVILVLLLGILLMVFPETQTKDTEPQIPSTSGESNLEDSLSRILSQVSGAGKVEVLLSEETGEKTVYQRNEDHSRSADATESRTDTVLVTDSQRNETGLIQQVNPPTYLGAIVLCQGADNAAVRLSIVKAVMSITGLTSDRITVLKMK